MNVNFALARGILNFHLRKEMEETATIILLGIYMMWIDDFVINKENANTDKLHASTKVTWCK